MSQLHAMACEQIEALLCKRIEAVRLMKNISQADLAANAGISRRTITRMENGKGVSLKTFIRVMQALDLTNQLETLIPSADIRPIERVGKKDKRRKHASKPRKTAEATKSTTWEWGNQ